MAPAPRDEIVLLLTRLAAHYWADAPEEIWQVRFQDYADDLADIPRDLLHATVRRYRRSGTWWPKLSELLEPIIDELAERRFHIDRMRRALGLDRHVFSAVDAIVRDVARQRKGDVTSRLTR